jgi:hypothetical protein
MHHIDQEIAIYCKVIMVTPNMNLIDAVERKTRFWLVFGGCFFFEIDVCGQL